jgi:ABC-type branched-subunit amino acid transport system permease subunit
VSLAWQLYVSTVLIYAGVDIMACWALNLQLGVSGVLNFAFIVFQAAGAYTAAVVTLGPATKNGFQQYVGGAHLPFPLPILAAAVVGALLALVVGAFSLRRLRNDYQAIVMLVVSLAATLVATNDVGLVNGPNGLSLIPKPLASALHVSPYGIDYQWFFVGVTAAACLVAYFFVNRITASPLGRTLRAMRDNEQVAAALGKNVLWLRLMVFMVGGALAAASGAVLVVLISAWSPSSWLFPETFSFFAAVIIGGSGNNMGALLGALLVPVGFLEAARFLPQFGNPALVGALQWMAVGLLLLVFLWFWPRGVIPERRRRFPAGGSG